MLVVSNSILDFSMLGANKNQSIHEVLTNLHHLDKHRPYGGLSMIFAGDLKQLGKVWKKRDLLCNYSLIEPVRDPFIFKAATIHSRSRAAGKIWDLFENFHLTEKVRSAGDLYFSHLCDRVGYNTLTSSDIEFLKSRDIPCLMEEDPENFKQGKVWYLLSINNNLAYLRLPT